MWSPFTSTGWTAAWPPSAPPLTQEQARLLKRYNENIVVCYDGDEAGQRAIQRAIGIFQEAGVDVKVCVVPGGQDPDEFVRDKGGQALIDLPCVESTAFRLDVAKQKRDLSSEEERAALRGGGVRHTSRPFPCADRALPQAVEPRNGL